MFIICITNTQCMKPIQQKIISLLKNFGYTDVKFFTDKYAMYKNQIIFKRGATFYEIEIDNFRDCLNLLQGSEKKISHRATYQKKGWKRDEKINDFYKYTTI
jgi:hypothetical protein